MWRTRAREQIKICNHHLKFTYCNACILIISEGGQKIFSLLARLRVLCCVEHHLHKSFYWISTNLQPLLFLHLSKLLAVCLSFAKCDFSFWQKGGILTSIACKPLLPRREPRCPTYGISSGTLPPVNSGKNPTSQRRDCAYPPRAYWSFPSPRSALWVLYSDIYTVTPTNLPLYPHPPNITYPPLPYHIHHNVPHHITMTGYTSSFALYALVISFRTTSTFPRSIRMLLIKDWHFALLTIANVENGIRAPVIAEVLKMTGYYRLMNSVLESLRRLVVSVFLQQC